MKKYISSVLFIGFIIGCIMFFSAAKKDSAHWKENAPIQVKVTGLEKERSIPLYGFNGNNIRGPHWNTPGLIESLQALHFQIIRYPGGGVGDWWDWKQGWFMNNAPHNFPLPEDYKKIKPVRNSIDDLKFLIDKTHCEILFTLNLITRSLQDQINMLQYAQNIGIPVKWIELGSEVNFQKNIGMKKFATAKAYADTCKIWIDSLKKYFPKARVGIVGGNKFFNADVQNWNETVLQTVRNTDAIVWHSYPLPQAILDSSLSIDFRKLHESVLKNYEKEGFNKIKDSIHIWLTEYNIHWAYIPKGNVKLIQQNAFTWSQALGILLLTSTATNISDKITMLINHNITGISIFAAIETMHKTFQLLPNGIGMQAWLQAIQDKTTMQKIQFSQNNRALPDYNLFGWKFNNQSSHSLLIVNLSKNAVKLDLATLKGQTKYVTMYAGKNDAIASMNDVHTTSGALRNNTVSLPPYSITTFTP